MSVTLPNTSTFNFAIKKGEDFFMELLVRTKDTHEAIDLTDAVFEGDCRDHVNSELLLFSFTFVIAPDQVTDKGKVMISIPKEITSELSESSGAYDIFVTYEIDGPRQPFMEGKITFQPVSTRVSE